MGCSSSQDARGPSRRGKGKTAVDITDFDMTKECDRSIKEFPFYSTRLQEIDWQRVVAKGEDWKDPHFKT